MRRLSDVCRSAAEAKGQRPSEGQRLTEAEVNEIGKKMLLEDYRDLLDDDWG